MTANDSTLAQAIRSGDDEAATTFYEKYSGKIFRMMFFSSSSQQEAEELTRETFLDFFESLPNFRGESRLSTWLYGIAKNVLKSYYVAKKRARFVSLDDEDTSREAWAFIERGDRAADGPGGLEPPEELVARRETADVVRAVLGRLTPVYREVLTLRYMEGLSSAEAAKVIGKSEPATRVLAHRASQAFARELGRLEARAGGNLVEL